MRESTHCRGLYVHIPFCLKKCHYCHFVITVDRSTEMRQNFLDALKREIHAQAQRYGRLRFETLYFGGGTPSALTPEEMRQIVDCLRDHFDFQAESEWTCEINPGDVDQSTLKTYRELGINRISMGIQTFDDDLLVKLNRPHGAREIFETAMALRDYGFKNVSVDFIARLPGQSAVDFEKDLRQALQLSPGQFSLYDLDVHEDTAFGVWQKQGRLALANETEHELMIFAAETLLEQNGYSQYALSVFARPGFESRHNLIYWHNGEYLGLGPGAFSYLSGERFQFATDVKRYLEKCETGDWAYDVCDRLNDEKKELETLLTGLRLREGVDIRHFQQIRADIESKIQPLLAGGFLAQAEGRLQLTRRGRFVAESVFAALV